MVFVVTNNRYICSTNKSTLFTTMSTWYADYSKLVDSMRPRTWNVTRKLLFLIHVPVIIVANLLYFPLIRRKRKQYVKN